MLSKQPGLLVVGAVHDSSEVAAQSQLEGSTTILIDQPPPDPKLARQLIAVASNCGPLFLVYTYNLAKIVALLQAGMAGCPLRDASIGDLARSIFAAGRGEIVLPLLMAIRTLAAMARGELVGVQPPESLSRREEMVLRLLAQGQTSKEIAQTLILSVRTTEAHRRNIHRKLGVRSPIEAVLWAVNHRYGPKDLGFEN